MRRLGIVSICLAAGLLVALAGGCATKTETKTAEPTTGPAAGKTLLIATANMTSHTDTATVTTRQTPAGPVKRSTAYIAHDLVASDARATGSVASTAQVDAHADDSGDMWGTWVLTNADGTWDGKFSNVLSSAAAAVPDTEYLLVHAHGTGAYKGLELIMLGSAAGPAEYASLNERFEPGTDQVLIGWIQKAE
jgi:hypothetical protein